jgi:hypothetical protein
MTIAVGTIEGRFVWNGTCWTCVPPPAFPPVPPCPPGPGPFFSDPVPLTGAPQQITGTAGTIGSQSVIVTATGTCTLTFPSAASMTGTLIYLKSIAPFALNSASSNIVPFAGGAAGTAIFLATAPVFAIFQSDGTNWVIMAMSTLG